MTTKQAKGQQALEILGHIHAAFTPSADGPGMQCVYACSLYGEGDDVTLAEAIASTLEVPAPLPLVQTLDQPAGNTEKQRNGVDTDKGVQIACTRETVEIPSHTDSGG